MTWDLLFEAMHAALMARERVSGTTLLDVAKAHGRRLARSGRPRVER